MVKLKTNTDGWLNAEKVSAYDIKSALLKGTFFLPGLFNKRENHKKKFKGSFYAEKLLLTEGLPSSAYSLSRNSFRGIVPGLNSWIYECPFEGTSNVMRPLKQSGNNYSDYRNYRISGEAFKQLS